MAQFGVIQTQPVPLEQKHHIGAIWALNHFPVASMDSQEFLESQRYDPTRTFVPVRKIRKSAREASKYRINGIFQLIEE